MPWLLLSPGYHHPWYWPCITHWGWVTHISIGNLTIIGSDNGLLPGRHQAIIWTNAGILLIGPLGINFCEIIIKIHIFSLKKMHLKMSGNWRPFCLSLNVILGLFLSSLTMNLNLLWCFSIEKWCKMQIWIGLSSPQTSAHRGLIADISMGWHNNGNRVMSFLH